MPRRCCVPMCRSNYDKEPVYTTVFSFPKDEALKSKWVHQIHRKDFVPSKSSVVCIKHFEESVIERDNRATRPDGTVLVVPRSFPILINDAYPTIFENQPSYMSIKLPAKRKLPEDRLKDMQRRNEAEFDQWLENDKISGFDYFKQNFESKLSTGWLVLPSTDDCYIGRIDLSDHPKFIVALKVSHNLSVSVWHNDLPLHPSQFKWLLGSEMKCVLWSTFECLISHLNGYSLESTTEKKLKSIATVLKQIAAGCDESSLQEKIFFLHEQLELSLMTSPRYSQQMLLWAAIFFFRHPSAYRSVRDSKKLSLPHPYYLKSLLQNLGNLQSGIPSTQTKYLSEKNCQLSEREKIVILLMDEIHVKAGLFYKGGRIEGLATNNDTEAATLQAFMITSVFSKNKDIVGLYPMKNQTTEDLFSVLVTVLRTLATAGYKVLCLISDNNRVNRKMYEKLGAGSLKSSVSNPAAPDEILFVLFDTVHLLKSIRNNWLNQSSTNQTFFIPSMAEFTSEINPSSSHSSSISMVASVLHLKTLYHKELNDSVKLAPSLSRKALYPSNLERQNVGHALRLFDEKLLPALESTKLQIGSDVDGTINFINIISNWWKIVNVKSAYKGKHLRDSYCEPIDGVKNNSNLNYLKKFSLWLDRWESLPPPPFAKANSRWGKLSKETLCALQHTTLTLILICEHLFHNTSPPAAYVLLGKFQTDCLEARFGQYRTMSGGNYHVSVPQVLESERKLKVISLMSLNSAKLGQFSIKTFLEGCKEEPDSTSDNSEFFMEAIPQCETVDISQENKKVLTYISGYVARVAVETCLSCKTKLTMNRVMEFETTDNEVLTYLGALDRGGLLWPNELTVGICSTVFKIFQTCISSAFEARFLKVSNQRLLIIELVEEKLEEEKLDLQRTCVCGKTMKALLHCCVKSMTNILLNNYCKIRNDKLLNKNALKRKLSTLTTK